MASHFQLPLEHEVAVRQNFTSTASRSGAVFTPRLTCCDEFARVPPFSMLRAILIISTKHKALPQLFQNAVSAIVTCKVCITSTNSPRYLIFRESCHKNKISCHHHMFYSYMTLSTFSTVEAATDALNSTIHGEWRTFLDTQPTRFRYRI